MLTLYKDQTPDPIIVMDEIIIEIKAHIKAKQMQHNRVYKGKLN